MDLKIGQKVRIKMIDGKVFIDSGIITKINDRAFTYESFRTKNEKSCWINQPHYDMYEIEEEGDF